MRRVERLSMHAVFLLIIHVPYLICSSSTTTLPALEDEIHNLVNILGKVSIASSYMDAIVEIERNKQFDGVIFAGHSTEGGFVWGDTVISAVEFVSICSLASAKWLFLNSCQSDLLVSQINSYLPGVEIVATKVPIDDDRAFRAMRLFISALRNEMTVSAALRKAKLAMPGQEYIYYPKANVDVENLEQNSDVEKRLSDLEMIVFGNAKMRILGLQETMVQVSKTIDGLRWWQMVNAVMMFFLILVFLWRNG